MSFKHCGISMTSETADDDTIHMFVSHGPCPEGRAEYNRRNAAGMETPPEVVARHTIDSGSETEDMTTDASSSESEVE